MPEIPIQTMLYNYLKVAWRSLVRMRLYSFLNITGLALGIASALLILLWVQDEYQHERFHAQLPQLYRVMEHQTYQGNDVLTTTSTPGIFGPWFKENYPEVERSTRYTWPLTQLLSYEEDSGFESGRYVDPDFLLMFSFPLRYGDAATALDGTEQIVLTAPLAMKYFGEENPVGKLMKLNDKTTLRVTAVLEPIPATSSLTFDYLLPFEAFWQPNQSWLREWDNNNVSTFVQLRSDLDLEAFNAKIRDIGKEYQNNRDFFVYPMADVYLKSHFRNGEVVGGRIEQVRIFLIIAFTVLLIACINFMNLSTAKAGRRGKEVGLRKVVGATRKHLLGQFMGESLFSTFLALALGVLIVFFALPAFNELTDKQIGFDLIGDNSLWMILGLGLLTSLVAGSYPALYLSAFRPAAVLKGQFKSGKRATRMRKVLVVTQFSLAIMLIISTITVYRQLQFMINQDLGFDKEVLLSMTLRDGMKENYHLIKEQLEAQPEVKAVSAMQHPPLRIHNNTYNIDWTGKDPEEKQLFSTVRVDYDWFEAHGITMAEGREFRKEMIDSGDFILNETAARRMGMDHTVVGESFQLWDIKGKVLGVTKDFHFSSLHSELEPIIMFLGRKDFLNYLVVKGQPGKMAEIISSMQAISRRYAPAYPFTYEIVEDVYTDMYEGEQKTGVIFRIFAILSVIISCLGLFGLSAFAAEQRTKEIGIRKTMGASEKQITFMLAKEFSQLVLLSAIIGCPIAWYFMDGWVEDFAYHITLDWSLFALATAGAFVIALLTVLYHALRSARSNPVMALRYE